MSNGEEPEYYGFEEGSESRRENPCACPIDEVTVTVEIAPTAKVSCYFNVW